MTGRAPSPLLLVNSAVWGALVLAPLALGDWQVGQLAQYFTYGLFAMSLALIWGHCGLLCFGQAVFFGIGAYAMSLVTLGMVPGLAVAPSSYLGILLAVLLPAGFANLLGRFLFYGRGLQGAYFAIVTLAIAVVAERLAINWNYIGGLNGLMNVPPMNLGLLVLGGGPEVWDSVPVYYVTLALVFAVYLLLEALTRSRYGIVLRAIRDNQDRTGYFGYDTAGYKLTAFTIGAGVAGLAGAVFVTQFNFASPPLIGFALSTEVLIWVALGGRTLLLAAFLGAILVRSVENVLSETLGTYWLLALGLLFASSVVLFPRGLIGEVIHRLTAPRRGAVGSAPKPP
jgi:urea ABC transporter permease protein UrtC